MKRIIYLLVFMGTLFMGCDPVQDIFDDLDAQDNPIVGSAEYTLVEDDYEITLGLDESNFTTIDQAKTMIPTVLDSLYPTWGNGSSVLVGFELGAGTDIAGIGDYTGADDYELTMDDYALSGSDVLGFYPDVDPDDYIPGILDDAIVSPVDGQIELVKYIQYTEVPVITATNSFTLEENFNYGTSAGDLTTISAGIWEFHSGDENVPVGYATTSLFMTDYPNSGIGGSSTIDGSGFEDVNSTFPEISSGNVYASVLVSLSAVSTGTYFFHVKDDGFSFSGRVGAKDDGFGKILFGIGASSSSLTYGTTPFDLDTTYLLVASYDIDSGVSNLYVLTAVEATEPATPEATNTGSSGRLVSAVAFRQSSFGGATGTLDGVRVSNTWNGIMNNFVTVLVEGDKVNTQVFYTYTDGDWEESEGVYFISDADFDSMGEGDGQPGRFNNFSNSVAPENYVPTFLGRTSPFAFGQEGDELNVIYKFFDGFTFLKGNLYTVVNGQWEAHVTQLQFGHDGDNWIPDNTIKYTFVTADYDYIIATYENIYPDLTANMATFGNFNGFDWTDEQILEVVGAVLLNNNPGAEEGQQYIVTYSIFDGSTHDEDISVILEGGVYVLND